MIRSGYRRMTEEERHVARWAEHVGCAEPAGCPLGCLASSAVFLAVCFFTWTIQWLVGWWLAAEAPARWALYTSIGVGMLGFAVNAVRFILRIASKSVRSDDARIGLVEVIHCQATDAIKIKFTDYDWDGYFLKLDKGIAIYLQNSMVDRMSCDPEIGPDDHRTLEERELDSAFPNRKFTVVRTAAEPRIVLSVECKGERFSPLLRIPAKEMTWSNEYSDGEIFHENWGDLVAKVNARKPSPKSETKPETSEGDSSP